MTTESQAAPVTGINKKAAPPAEVVLPAAYYALLLAEVAALVALAVLAPEQSGSGRYSYLLGWAGTASMVLMHIYSLRRRLKAMRGLGRLRSWLHLHIFLGLQGALFVTYHSLHLHQAKSIQGLNILCVAIVVASGLFGRYLYALIPKSLAGDRLNAKQIEAELADLKGVGGHVPTPEVAAAIAACEQDAPTLTGRVPLLRILGEDLRARRALRQLERALADRQTQLLALHSEREDREKLEAFVAATRRRVMLARRLATFNAAERLFRGWTILHKPLTFILLGATILHVLGHYIYSAGMTG
ncbi:MAG: hypothetical protein EXR72_01325 [Myxococcales bacterium]|nr:hypothetical protein [Myxococcales bacterium]